MMPLTIATNMNMVAIPTNQRVHRRGKPYNSKWKRYKNPPPRVSRGSITSPVALSKVMRVPPRRAFGSSPTARIVTSVVVWRELGS